eukprot:1157329-Pelagomonas_calceolata.AAC.3
MLFGVWVTLSRKGMKRPSTHPLFAIKRNAPDETSHTPLRRLRSRTNTHTPNLHTDGPPTFP